MLQNPLAAICTICYLLLSCGHRSLCDCCESSGADFMGLEPPIFEPWGSCAVDKTSSSFSAHGKIGNFIIIIIIINISAPSIIRR